MRQITPLGKRSTVLESERYLSGRASTGTNDALLLNQGEDLLGWQSDTRL
ncbi:hypothetical protein HNQ39_003238 [Armatimonas rosea]|uniref:Uncharacterized protein n=1 Tax=Armatimonas rosea TaxID=685828 RepID=A0A7W9SSG6_ARMRO|nr:hypothetical protein [Armatimonas rosea]